MRKIALFVFAAGGAVCVPRVCTVEASGSANVPILRFGVASDVHLSKHWDQEKYLEKALRWFDSEKADAVVFPGDMTHSGCVSELESLAAVWEKVFPNRHARDGRPVERLMVTGNHEIGQWPSLWKNVPDAELRKIRFDYDLAHASANWKRIFGEDYETMFVRKIKGVSFVGIQYPRGVNASGIDYAGFFRNHDAELRTGLPFFVVQHSHPPYTCYGSSASSAWAERGTPWVLPKYPNAVVLSGHSHNSPCDRRSVWQGAYTSIGCGSLIEAAPCYDGAVQYDNGGAPYDPKYKKQRMVCIPQVGNDGKSCLMVVVYKDKLVVKRHSVVFDEPLGPDWELSYPHQRPCVSFDFEASSVSIPPPQFPADARVSVDVDVVSPKHVGPGLKGKSCVRVTFPRAIGTDGSRVLDYVVHVFAKGSEIHRSYVLDYDYYLPMSRTAASGECLLGKDEIPHGIPVRFAIEPRNCYGTAGRELLSESLVLK